MRSLAQGRNNAQYDVGEEFDIPEGADSGVLKDEEITLHYGENGKLEHRSRRIAYWDAENGRLFEFITNNFDLPAEKVALIYKIRQQLMSYINIYSFLEDPEIAFVYHSRIQDVILVEIFAKIFQVSSKAVTCVIKDGRTDKDFLFV